MMNYQQAAIVLIVGGGLLAVGMFHVLDPYWALACWLAGFAMLIFGMMMMLRVSLYNRLRRDVRRRQ